MYPGNLKKLLRDLNGVLVSAAAKTNIYKQVRQPGSFCSLDLTVKDTGLSAPRVSRG